MNKKWYRSNYIKVILIAAFHGALVLAAACGVFLAAMVSHGIRIWGDEGDRYIESGGFTDTLYNSSNEILSGLDVEDALLEEDSDAESKVIDLQEVYEGQELTYENHSGLAYSVADLNDWAKSSWGEADFYDGKNVVICTAENGEQYYYYYKDFRQMTEDGTMIFNFEGLQELYATSKEEAVAEFLDGLSYGQDDVYEEALVSVEDKARNVEYKEVKGFMGLTVEEKYAPAGAENLLDAVNENPNWEGGLAAAYKALDQALNMITVNKQKAETLKQYKEGNTNLTYMYVDLDENKVYTNKSSYSRYAGYETALKEMAEEDAYVIVRPKLSECESNLNFSGSRTLQMWQHMADNEGISENYILALSVDGAFPVADSMAESAGVYRQYAGLRIPFGQALILAVVLLLVSFVWLTVIAGRRAGDEEVHVIGFDRIFTEIAAVGVFGIWAAGLSIFFTLLDENFRMDFDANFNAVLITAEIAAIYTAAMFLVGYLSLVRRIKARTILKNSLLRWLLKLAKKMLKKAGNVLELFSRNTPGKLKIALLAGGFLLFQFVVNGIIFSGGAVFFLVLTIADCAAFLYLIRKADGRDRILEGLKRISGGELQYKIPADKLTGDQKTMAEYINHIGEGLDAAVENSLKNERMKTELITNVSHDIKTPLTSIINYVDLLKRENFTDPKICGYLDILEAKAQRLKVLTEDVVEASKASSGTLTLEMTDLNFSELLHQVMGEFEERFEEKNLTLMVHFADEPMIVHADGQRLWRVLENIFGNVVKYALEGTRVYVQTTPEKGRVVFSLKNISAQPLNISADELTERFIRGDVSRNTEGSGLGLSIAKSLTELQGGEFRLYLDGDLFKVIITFPLKNC